MEVNKDEALRCINIAKRHLSNGNKEGALKFAKKSIGLYPTPQGKSLLEEIQSESTTTGKTTGAQHHHTHPKSKSSSSSSSTSSNNNNNTSNTTEKKHTPEQAKAVKTILACGTDYYKVLSIDKKCTEVEIKKSYRKLALQFHPDKNSAPGADEAFKLISKAFTVLSDPQKRAIHDASGGDPEIRSTSSSYQQQQYYSGGRAEMTPDELFDMFFGGGGLRQPHYHRRQQQQFRHPFFNARQQQQPQHQTNNAIWWIQALPILVLFLYAIITSLFSQETAPLYKFQPTTDFSQARTTSNLNIHYYVNPTTFQPIAKTGGYKLNRVERQVEQEYVNNVNARCQSEKRSRSYRLSQARGSLFGIGFDEEKYQKALKMTMKNCDEMRRLGFDPDYLY